MARSRDLTIELINQRLKALECCVVVRKKRHTLYLRTSALPPKPGAAKSTRVDLPTQLHETQDGLKQAEILARRLDEMIRLGLFDWGTYKTMLMPGREEEGLTIDRLIEKFRTHYLQTQDIQESTWKDGWAIALSQLPQNKELTPKILVDRIQELPPNSAIRRRTCARLQAFADFCGVQVNLRQYQGNYSHQSVERRELPSDEAIAQFRSQIKNDSWKWAYGVLAAYGIRPHELFFCQFVGHRLKVTDGKTGPREVLIDPFYPEWFEEWDLAEISMPNVVVEGRSHIQIGKSIANQFGKIRLYIAGFPEPYQLRHCYAIRLSSIFSIPVPVASKLMGHSPDVHLRTYSRWLNESHKDQVIRQVLSREDLPKAPK